MNRLQGKDLINIGIFTAIYFIVIFAAASIGFIPIFIPLISVIVPLVGGIPMMLFFSKIKKFGMLTICGLLLGVIMLLTGMGYWCIPTGLIFGLISDFMMKGCGYKNAKREVLIHGVFSMWVIGAFIPIVVTRDAYYQNLLPGYGQEYADTLMAYRHPRKRTTKNRFCASAWKSLRKIRRPFFLRTSEKGENSRLTVLAPAI